MRSYRKIDYRLRPAKHAERLMIVECLRRLDRFSRLDAYRYVGFGSPFFVDFRLFHLALRIENMISIESGDADEERFRFNRPYSCIELVFGHSTSVLPGLEWTGRNVVWLDYDGELNQSVISDVSLLATKMQPGSVLIVTVRAEPEPLDERIEHLSQSLGRYLPTSATESSLGHWGTADLFAQILRDSISHTLGVRNGGAKPLETIEFQQLLHFQYRDGVRMATIGGVFTDGSTRAPIGDCRFEDFDFYRPDINPYQIETPNLTAKEVSMLDSFLPCERHDLDDSFLPKRDVDRYHQLYRYLPNYRDVNR